MGLVRWIPPTPLRLLNNWCQTATWRQMKFTLVFDSPLPPGKYASKDDKHHLRVLAHRQLKHLWDLKPLPYYTRLWTEEGKHGHPFTDPPDPTQFDMGAVPQVRESWGGIDFIPLVCQSLALVAELDIKVLVPGSDPGDLIKDGDIDNRIKTLLDGLRMPRNKQELPSSWAPDATETPFFALLQDDTLVTRISVALETRLSPPPDGNILALVAVHVRARMGTIHNMGLIG